MNLFFCMSLEVTTTTTDTNNKLKNYIDAKNISVNKKYIGGKHKILWISWCSCYDGQEKWLLKNDER